MLLRHLQMVDTDKAFEVNGVDIPARGGQIDVPDEVGRYLLRNYPKRVKPWPSPAATTKVEHETTTPGVRLRRGRTPPDERGD